MKGIQSSFIFAICLLAFTAIVFIFKYANQKIQANESYAEAVAAQNFAKNIEMQAQVKSEELQRLSKLASDKAKSDFDKAQQAKEMLEKAQKESKMSQKEIIDALNVQLNREADARLAAENASLELIKQRDILKKTVEDTKKALDKLKNSKGKDHSVQIKRMQTLLAEKEAQIVALKKRQAELEALRTQAELAQLKTQEEISNQGGEISVPKVKLIVSPNMRFK